MKNIARPLLERLAEHHTLTRPEIVTEQVSADGTRKWLLRMPSTGKHDRGAEIECVYIPESDRGTLCVSSQVGCTLNCTFCHTGTQKWVRNLTTAEIVGQVLVARDRLGDFPGGVAPTDGLVPSGEGVRAVSNIVFMGMGEPLYNIDNVRDAIGVLTDGDGLSLSKRRITVSTSGVVPEMDKLGRECGTMLAVSLHATNNELRDELVPLNKKYPIEAAAEGLPRLSRRLQRTAHHVRICHAEGRQRHAGRGARAGAPAQGPARQDQPDPLQSLARQPLRMLGLGNDRAIFRHRVQCGLCEPGAHAARPRHPGRLRPVEERNGKAARPRAPDARGDTRRWPRLIQDKAPLTASARKSRRHDLSVPTSPRVSHDPRPPAMNEAPQIPPAGGVSAILEESLGSIFKLPRLGWRGGALILAVVVVGWCSTSIYSVQPDEQGVVLRFGRWVDTTRPGLHFHWPYPIETVLLPKVTKINQIQLGNANAVTPGLAPTALPGDPAAGRERQMLTGDENIVEADCAVFWKIRDAGQFLFKVDSPELAVKIAAEGALRDVISRTPIQAAMSDKRQQIADETRALLQQLLDKEQAGIEITQVQLQRVEPPLAVIDAFNDVQRARADQERARNEAAGLRQRHPAARARRGRTRAPGRRGLSHLRRQCRRGRRRRLSRANCKPIRPRPS